MDFLFGKRKTPQEMLREHKRAIDKAIRELERERNGLVRQEQRVVIEIKKMAKANEMDSVKIMARDLVRTRKHQTKFYKMKTQLQAVSLRISTLKSNAAMAEAMAGVTKTMGMMNRRLNAPAINRIMMEFEKQTEMMDMKEEVINDSLDDVMDSEEDEDDETEAVVNKVLDEIGIDLGQKMADTPQLDSLGPASKQKESRQAIATGDHGSAIGKDPVSSSNGKDNIETDDAPTSNHTHDDLMARLEALKKG